MLARTQRRFKHGTAMVSAPYLVYFPHDAADPPTLDGPWLQVAAIDPAIRNCAIRVERREWASAAALAARAAPVRTRTIVQKKFDFLELGGGGALGSETRHFRGAAAVIESLREYFEACHYVLVEAQMPVNTDMIRMAQAIITTLCAVMKNAGVRGVVVEIDPRFKTAREFNPALSGAAARMNKASIKRWAAAHAIATLRASGEDDVADFIEGSAKRDDHGDVVCYTTAWFRLVLEGGFAFLLPPFPKESAADVDN